MFRNRVFLAAPLLMGGLALAQSTVEPRAAIPLKPTTMKVIGSVDPRYQSYNLEMLEVMGGNWWARYGTQVSTRNWNNIASWQRHRQFAFPLSSGPLKRRARVPTFTSRCG
jgi:hypothetical protein